MKNSTRPSNALAGPPDRRAPRQRAFLSAKLVYLDSSISIDCSVTHISATGAKINIKEDVNLPERFLVEIPLRRVKTEARLVWRDADSIAVAFGSEARPFETSPSALSQRIRVLEAENRMLRATCQSLNEQLAKASGCY